MKNMAFNRIRVIMLFVVVRGILVLLPALITVIPPLFKL